MEDPFVGLAHEAAENTVGSPPSVYRGSFSDTRSSW